MAKRRGWIEAISGRFRIWAISGDPPPTATRHTGALVALIGSPLIVGAETAFSLLVFGRSLPDVIIVYLLGVVFAAMRFGYATSILTSILSVAAYDFFFVPPFYSFAVTDGHDTITFLLFFVTACAISYFTEQIRRVAVDARERELQERVRSTLLSSVSHDLRTPLAVVSGAVSTLIDCEDTMTTESRRECLQAIRDQGERLNGLVGHLLDVTSLEAGTVCLRKDWESLEEIVGIALRRFDVPLTKRPVHVRIDDEATMVPADATLLEQVLVNLIENVLKYTPPLAPLEISARRRGDGVEVTVADGGPGVPRGHEERIFEKFYRANRSSSGMGLGLTICRGILIAHGGRIWCENRPGGGAAFSFVLPASGDDGPRTVLPASIELVSEHLERRPRAWLARALLFR
jgi:two-component system sensor histidine kinase KdpD